MRKLGLIIVGTGILCLEGSFIFSLLEGWRVLDSFYFIIMTMGTIGYGDFVPSTDFGKLLSIFFVVIKYPIGFYAGSIVLSDRLCLLKDRIESDIGDEIKAGKKTIISELILKTQS